MLCNFTGYFGKDVSFKKFFKPSCGWFNNFFLKLTVCCPSNQLVLENI